MEQKSMESMLCCAITTTWTPCCCCSLSELSHLFKVVAEKEKGTIRGQLEPAQTARFTPLSI